MPDIRGYIDTGDKLAAQLKLVMAEVQAEDPDIAGDELPEVIDAAFADYRTHLDPETSIIPAFPKRIITEALGEKISWVRLLAVGQDNWEVLVEIESEGDTHVELEEPYIATLPYTEFEESTLIVMSSHSLSLSFSLNSRGVILRH